MLIIYQSIFFLAFSRHLLLFLVCSFHALPPLGGLLNIARLALGAAFLATLSAMAMACF
jgi:hypothetical protein